MKQFDFEKMPIVEIANEILLDAVKMGVSDIHFDPSKDDLKIRVRIDGILSDYSLIPAKYKRNLISRIKMIAGMNIMETRLPQDGAIKSKIGDNNLDVRVSSLPTNTGEKVVLRIMDYSKSFQGLESLGFSESNYRKINHMIEVPNGIILVTGATGSGKSTTVYSILQKMNTSDVNIITVEDPVEMDILGINQVQAQSEIGLTFASVLRSILRQDPDIIMIGEIRDDETARIAVRASITGHKVLSTIHTNNSLNTIERLTDMDVERYLLGSALTGIISQKLARRICPKCRVLRGTTDYEKEVFKKVLGVDIAQMYDVNTDGCEECFKGYKGRIALLEVLVINDEIRDAITNAMPKNELRELVYRSDVTTLLQDGLDKVIQGETSFSEILKAVDLDNDLTNYTEDNLRKSMQDTETHNNSVNEQAQKIIQETKPPIAPSSNTTIVAPTVPATQNQTTLESPTIQPTPPKVDYVELITGLPSKKLNSAPVQQPVTPSVSTQNPAATTITQNTISPTPSVETPKPVVNNIQPQTISQPQPSVSSQPKEIEIPHTITDPMNTPIGNFPISNPNNN